MLSARIAFTAAVSLVVCAAFTAGCNATSDDQVTSPTVLGMTASLTPAYNDGQEMIFQVKTPVALPYRKPTAAETAALGPQDPYPHFPFLQKSDSRVNIRYTISNLDTAPHVVTLMLDPWNEFVRWVPGLVLGDDDSIPDESGYSKVVSVAAMSRLEGTITSDDVDELATDLATVEYIQAHPPASGDGDDDDDTTAAAANAALDGLYNHVFDPQNRSNEDDPLLTGLIPSVVPGIVGFDLGLRTSEPAALAVEITVEIEDLNGNRVLPYGSADKPIGEPMTSITPPGSKAL
jgi:hypothetical protein